MIKVNLNIQCLLASAALLLIRPQLKEESQLLELLQILEIRGQQTPWNEQSAARAPFGLRIEAEKPTVGRTFD